MGTVTINGQSYTIYGERTGAGSAQLYHQAGLHGFIGWADADETTQEMALVTATRMLDRQRWQGTKTVGGQTLAWPRTGVVDYTGVAVDSVLIPQRVIDATYELALALLVDPDGVQSKANANVIVRRAEAGSAKVEFFRPISRGRFDQIVQELVGEYLLGIGGSLSGLTEAWGTDSESAFDDDDFYGISHGG